MVKTGITILFFALFSFICRSQDNNNSEKDVKDRVMFYNVENYFDSEHDSTLSYNDFTPYGDLHWTNSKYVKKRNNIYKVIKAVGGWKPVTLIGSAEIENEFVISDMINNTPLGREGYRYVHFQSNDFRGIDVALIYHSVSFVLLHSEKVVIHDPENPDFTTRDILYVVGLLNEDTLHVIVNHWTSRYGGYLETESKRMLASQKLKYITDSICERNENANIILLGDFNDNPENKSMQLHTTSSVCGFYNLNLINSNPDVSGSLKYKNSWFNFDQILVTNSLVAGTNGLKCSREANIFDADFLLEEDLQYFGLKTNRTNIGYKYHGGFSDHLPVFVDIISTR